MLNTLIKNYKISTIVIFIIGIVAFFANYNIRIEGILSVEIKSGYKILSLLEDYNRSKNKEDIESSDIVKDLIDHLLVWTKNVL